MFPGGILEQVKFVKVKDHSAAGTTEIDSDSVDMAADGGWDGVVFVSSFGTAAANNVANLQASADDSAWSDIAGSAPAVSSSDEDIIMSVVHPPGRYVRAQMTPTTSSTVESIWAILFRGKSLPYTGNTLAGTRRSKEVISPALGTP
ncbi:MAG: hypothetical protein ACKVT0_21600 [Planctomycetaceae bacterium]